MAGSGLKNLGQAEFETLLREMANRLDPRIDLSGVGFVDPFGLLGLLVVGRALSEPAAEGTSGRIAGEDGARVPLRLPDSEEVLRYLVRMDFPTHAVEYFAATGPHMPDQVPRAEDSPVLLEITRVVTSNDVQHIVQRIQDRLAKILITQLGYTELHVNRFAVAVSEICQNIPDHAQAPGLIAIQRYHYAKRLGRNLVKIAVADAGVGIRRSLAPRYGSQSGQVWDDQAAISMAFERGVSRVEDPGRGQGLKRVREMVKAWGGSLLVRSGTAQLQFRGGRSQRAPVKDLVPLPGTQILIELPAVEAATSSLPGI